jgi:5-deoxy-D-glucuronate isomerase
MKRHYKPELGNQETYYYRLTPSDGFVIQRIYTRDTDLDVAIPLHDGDLVLVHEGYHPVVKAPDYRFWNAGGVCRGVHKARRQVPNCQVGPDVGGSRALG